MGSIKNLSTIPKSVTFGLYSPDEIRKLSVVEITNPVSFNALGHPTTGGLYDPRMGPWSEKGDACATCTLGPLYCPGHFGHLELPIPTFHPLFQRVLISILKISCPACKRLLCKDSVKAMLVGQMDLLDSGLITQAQRLAESIHLDDDDDDEGDVEDLLSNERPKKTKKSKSKESNAIREASIKKEIEKLVEEMKQEHRNQSAPTRLTESLRQLFVKTFLSRISSATSCSFCRGGWKKTIFYRSRIVYVLKSGTVSTAVGGHVLSENVEEIDKTGSDEEAQEETTNGKAKPKKKSSSSTAMPTMYLTPNDAREHLRELWRHDGDVLADLFPVLKNAKSEYPTDVFFIEVLPVCPPKFRPVNFSGGTLKENAQSVLLRKVVEDTFLVKAVLYAYKHGESAILTKEAERMIQSVNGQTLLEKLQTVWLQLQADVDAIADTSERKDVTRAAGFKQLIEKKEGLFRMNMMGKRVNYAARSVITPDPNIGVEEIGIPVIFAKKLTYPTPVTPWNYNELRQMVCNGPDVHPGAVSIEGENGRIIRLSSTDPRQREGAAKLLLPPTEKFTNQKDLFRPKIVHRHLRTGDVMLLNRQPSLHKPSIMAHKARVLPGEKTLRLHYSNCKSYNADFDGDEMNAHFPQSELGRSEAYNIVAVPHQYLVPKDGTPLSGLIQDHIVSAVRLTKRGKFFNRADYQQLVYVALGSRGGVTKLLPPALIKPVTMWSGKQIISTVVINLAPPNKPPINLHSKAKTSIKDWQSEPPRRWKAGGTPIESNSMTESEVIFRQGELVCGVLDKMQHGATSFSLVHTFYELYGGEFSSRLLSAFGRLFTAFLQLEGFTLGVKDILLTPQADQRRREILKRAQKVGDTAASRAVGLDPEALKRGEVERSELVKRMAEAHLSKAPFKRMALDREYKTLVDEITNEVNRTCTPGGLLLRFPENNLALMVQSGAKGSAVNSMQISCLLGQIELEGKRPPLMISGRSLPSFVPYETSPRAGGFVAGRFMTGIRPQEFFFHCMAGREGLVDTAVKTSRSGYLQRCLIKHLEGVHVAYDQTVRDSDGTVIQFMYGEDGLDVCRSQYLSPNGLPIIVANRDCLVGEVKQVSEEDEAGIRSMQKSIKRWRKKYHDLSVKRRMSPFTKFSASFEWPEEENRTKSRPGRTQVVDRVEADWRELHPAEKEKYAKKAARAPNPVATVYPVVSYPNVLTEGLEKLVDKYAKSSTLDISRSELISLVNKKAVKGVCDPGEPVGLLAAQSVGEPSTQMTLNTFHFAGRGEMNVTLGIPRLREILMVASDNIKTPSMDIPLKEKGELGLKQAENLKLQLTRVTLADVLERVDVTERLVVRGQRRRQYILRFEFLPHSLYKDRYCVKPSQLLRYIETHFIHRVLLPGMRKEAEAQAAQSLFTAVSASRAREGRAATAADEDETEQAGRPEEATEKSTAEAVDADVEDESDLEGGGDADTLASRMRARHDDEHEYEEADETISAAQPDIGADEENADQEDEGFTELLEDDLVKEEKDESENAEQVDDDSPTLTTTKSPKEKSISEEAALERRLKLLDKDPWISDYEFDRQKQKWCQVTISVSLNIQKVDLSGPVRQWAEAAVVHQVPKIKRAFVVAPKTEDGDIVVKTEGINIKAMFAYSDILDLNRLYSNDIHAVARQYGIEAASRVIVNEIRNVFQVYGITVDPRHLSLIASYMTCSGVYRPFNRTGMTDCASPLQQISFETATNFLKMATLQGKTDHLESPSSRLVLGLPVKMGTGSFELLRKVY